jgi:hypothetical protein
LKRQRDRINDVLARFNDHVLDEVARRGELTNVPDGFGIGGGGGSVRGGDDTSSTERAALQLAEGRRDYDVQQTSVERIDDAFQSMWDAVIAAERAWDVILNASEGIRGRQTSLGACQACFRDDVPNVGSNRIRAGYCPACFTAWCRTDQGSGRMDRFTFERGRRAMRVVEPDGTETPVITRVDADERGAIGNV